MASIFDWIAAARPKTLGAAIAPVAVGCALAEKISDKLDWTLADLAQSAYAIDAQQVSLGEWARDELPEDARIGVNDTGAIAYMSGRKTFDDCGDPPVQRCEHTWQPRRHGAARHRVRPDHRALQRMPAARRA